MGLCERSAIFNLALVHHGGRAGIGSPPGPRETFGFRKARRRLVLVFGRVPMIWVVFLWFSHVSGRSGGRADERDNPPRAQACDSSTFALCWVLEGSLAGFLWGAFLRSGPPRGHGERYLKAVWPVFCGVRFGGLAGPGGPGKPSKMWGSGLFFVGAF